MHQVCLCRTNQHWLTMHLMITTWPIGRPPLFWTENLSKVLDGSKRQYIFENKDDNPILERGQGQLHAEPHVRPISCRVASLSWQEPEEELNKLLLTKVSDRDRNVKGKNVGCVKLRVFFVTNNLPTEEYVSRRFLRLCRVIFLWSPYVIEQTIYIFILSFVLSSYGRPM